MTNNPEEAMAHAKRLMRPQLAKRFYKTAEVSEAEGGYAVSLDGRVVRTPARNLLATPWRALTARLAQEWAAQGDSIDPSTMPMSRVVNSAIDGVSGAMEAVRADAVKYAGSDLLCYRADGPDRLIERQRMAWDDVLAWARDDLGARFVLAEGVMFVEQPPEAIAAVARAVEPLDPFRLAALHVATTLMGSVLLALALERGRLDPAQAWAAAHVDEDWTSDLWGRDEEAETRRAGRFEDLKAAAGVLDLAR
jgi:chaperone required for assembly of F1-ATPase